MYLKKIAQTTKMLHHKISSKMLENEEKLQQKQTHDSPMTVYGSEDRKETENSSYYTRHMHISIC